ncbi:hypothetical protein [Mesorhizobium sp. CN2-181]|uniref:hypothetical protein n=1 Tax=Mesorhizobium yinganensis TaxID=3157707 RepID=UPI0032B73145
MNGKLSARIREFKNGHSTTLNDLTVLAAQNDPYRVDTPAGHRDAQWFLEQFEKAIGARESIHLRGLHYAIVARGDVKKPNGQLYRNTDADWSWLQVFPAKAARWLGYIDFEKVRDQRNDPPVVHRADASSPEACIIPGELSFTLPDVDDIDPIVYARNFEGRQPYHLVIFGEKSSLAEVALPIAKRYGADVYLPAGELTDSLVHKMASDAASDGRPMRVFTLADCDPAGHQMPVSIGRKLQAFRDLKFHDLDFEVRQIGLTVEQVKELELPSTPLKESERRADRWRSAFGVEQTEIDALAQLRPDVLRQIVDDALKPFHDNTLSWRVLAAKNDWQEEAQGVLDDNVDQRMLDHLRRMAEHRLGELQKQIDHIKDELHVGIPDGIELPDIVIPEAVIDENFHSKPLVSSRWSWREQTAALKAHKSYGGEE